MRSVFAVIVGAILGAIVVTGIVSFISMELPPWNVGFRALLIPGIIGGSVYGYMINMTREI